MINNPNLSTRYPRRHETKNVLDFIHGGEEASLYGAWDYLSSSASESLMENFLGNYKKGSLLTRCVWKGHKGV